MFTWSPEPLWTDSQAAALAQFCADDLDECDAAGTDAEFPYALHPQIKVRWLGILCNRDAAFDDIVQLSIRRTAVRRICLSSLTDRDEYPALH